MCVCAQAASVQLMHCMCPGCGLPHRIMWLSVYRFPVTVLALSLSQRASHRSLPLYFCLRNVLWPFETDMEKKGHQGVIAPRPHWFLPWHVNIWLTWAGKLTNLRAPTFLLWNVEVYGNILFKQPRFSSAKFWHTAQWLLFTEHL